MPSSTSSPRLCDSHRSEQRRPRRRPSGAGCGLPCRCGVSNAHEGLNRGTGCGVGVHQPWTWSGARSPSALDRAPVRRRQAYSARAGVGPLAMGSLTDHLAGRSGPQVGHAPCPKSGEICTAPLDSIARDCRLFPGSPKPPKPLKSARNEGVRGTSPRVGSSLSGPSRPFCIVPRSLKGGPRRPQAAGRGAERPLRTAGARARERRGVLGVPQSYDPAPQWLGRGLRRCAVVPPLPVRGPGPGARAGGAAGRVGCAMYSPFSARPHQGPRATRYLTAGDTRA